MVILDAISTIDYETIKQKDLLLLFVGGREIMEQV